MAIDDRAAVHAKVVVRVRGRNVAPELFLGAEHSLVAQLARDPAALMALPRLSVAVDVGRGG